MFHWQPPCVPQTMFLSPDTDIFGSRKKREWESTSSPPPPPSLLPPLFGQHTSSATHQPWHTSHQHLQQQPYEESPPYSVGKRCRTEASPSSVQHTPHFITSSSSSEQHTGFHHFPSILHVASLSPASQIGGQNFAFSPSSGASSNASFLPAINHNASPSFQQQHFLQSNHGASGSNQSTTGQPWFQSRCLNQSRTMKVDKSEPIRQCFYCGINNSGSTPITAISVATPIGSKVKIISCSQCSKNCCQTRCVVSCDECNSMCCTGCMMVDYSHTFERKLCYDCYYAMSQ